MFLGSSPRPCGEVDYPTREAQTREFMEDDEISWQDKEYGKVERASELKAQVVVRGGWVFCFVLNLPTYWRTACVPWADYMK